MTQRGLSLLLDSLTHAEQDPEVRALTAAFGGDPVEVRERLIGAPAVRSRRMLFASGGEIILHDDAVVEVLLHVVPQSPKQQGVDLAEWLPGPGNDATLDDLNAAIGTRRGFAGIGTPWFAVDGAFVRADFRDRRGWNEPGNLESLAITVEQPGLVCAPDDDDCPRCADLLIRWDASEEVDVEATDQALRSARDAGDLKEDLHWVPLDDLRMLHGSGLMTRVESQLTCRSCRRVICFALQRDGAPSFTYCSVNDARRHPLEEIPPVERWGSAERQAAAHAAMQYVDHSPGAWFLVRQGERLYLDARYSYSALIDTSALIELDASERESYRRGGHTYLGELAYRIHMSGPYQEESPYYARDLYRGGGDPGRDYRSEVSAAIVNHTWLAQQRSQQG
ncbi:hypothetical protein MHM582_1014 [Microbacterium sp. HM58-2]|nr:hypothetical protein MHM582_1014 [Microbacterium sp. HM58-2]